MAQLEFQFADIWDRRGRWLAVLKDYAVAIGIVLVCFGVRLLIDPYVQGSVPYITFFLGVIVASVLVSTSAAFSVTAASLLLAIWFFVEPRNSWALAPAEILNGVAFAITSLALVILASNGKRALYRERRVTSALQARARELAASEELNRRILASSGDCIELLALDGSLVSISEGGKRLLNIEDTSRMLRKPWVELWPSEYREEIQECVDRARRGQHACFDAARYHQVRESSELVPSSWFDVVVAPIYDQHGRPERLLAVSRDVTERRHAEEARRVSEQRRELAMAAIGDSVWDLDIEHDHFLVNENFEKKFGKPENSNWKSWWLGQIHPQDRKRLDAALTMALGSKTTHWTCEYRLLRLDGTWAHVLDRAIIARDAQGRANRVVGAIIDMTRQMRADRRTMLLARTSSALLCTESPQQVVEHLCNDVLEFLECDVFLNYLMEEETGGLKLNASGGLNEKDKARISWLEVGTAICGCVAVEGKPLVASDIQSSNDPKVQLVRSYGVQAYACHPLIVHGKVIGTLSFGTRRKPRFDDEEVSLMKAVTDQVAIAMERERTATELRMANEELEKRVAERTKSLHETTDQLNSFCYSVAHDMRAPLRTQTGFARLLIEDYGSKLDDTGRYYLRAIMQSAERQSNIIQDLMAHVNVSRADLPMEPVELHDAFWQVQADLEMELQQKRAVLDFSGLDSERVMANRSSLHLVFLNLISNACKFVAPGVDPHVRVWTEQRNSGRLRVYVQDNGIGIDPKDAGRLFGMFQRLQKGQYPGTGMGLAIVKTAVERMSGAVGFESAPNEGSKFWVELPSDNTMPMQPRIVREPSTHKGVPAFRAGRLTLS